MEQIATTTQDDTNLFTHDTRPEWGHAVLAWDHGDKRGYQFEDGTLRVFKRGWYDRLQPADLPLPRARATARRLCEKLGRVPAKMASPRGEAIPFERQLALFRELYPEGFSGATWERGKRGGDAKRRLKRHRDAATKHARTALSAARLAQLMVSDRFDEAWNELLEVLRATDLVTATHLKPLRDIDGGNRRELVLCTRALLWGDGPYDVRFERFVSALAVAIGRGPSWQLATALSALAHPQEHVAVRPSAIASQAAWMAPRLRMSRSPNAADYMRIRAMVSTVRSELESAGLAPRDLLDVHDFMWETLRPSARKRMTEAALADASDSQDDDVKEAA